MALVLAHNSVLSDWLSFFSSLFWPLVSLVAVILFKDQIRDLINRVKRVKVGGIETEFEQPVDESVIEPAAIHTDVSDIEPPLPEAPVGLDMIGLLAPGGFLTERGVDQVIRQSGFLKPNEEVLAHLLLLKTTKQRTWLVATSDWIFCLLDDERTRLASVADGEHVVPVSGTRVRHSTGGIDVPLNEVTTEPGIGTERKLEIDSVALGQLAERGAPKRLRNNVDSKAGGIDVRRRETNSGDGNAVTERQRGRYLVALDRELDEIAFVFFSRFSRLSPSALTNGSQGLHQSGEH